MKKPPLRIQPMPWVAEHDGGGRIYDANGILVTANLTSDEADFIVAACNTHADLLAALKALVEAVAAYPTPPGELDDARDAIKKAEGR